MFCDSRFKVEKKKCWGCTKKMDTKPYNDIKINKDMNTRAKSKLGRKVLKEAPSY